MRNRKKYVKQLLFLGACFLSLIVTGQNLQEYLNIAEKNSPALKAANYKYQSVLEKTNEVSSLGNTNIGVGYFLQEVETRVGSQKAKLSVSQQIPWFGTLAAKKKSVMLMSETELNEIELIKNSLFFEVEKSYFNLYELKASIVVYKETLRWLKVYEKLALTELENNKISMVDVVKIGVEINQIQNQIETTNTVLKSNERTFNTLLNRDENIIVIVPESLLIQDRFLNNNVKGNTSLTKLGNLQLALKQSEIAVQKEGLPKIGLGLDYVFVSKIPNVNITDNGKDIIMPMLSVSLPIFSKKYTSKRKQLQLEQKAIEYKKKDLVNSLSSQFDLAKTKIANAKLKIKTQDKNIKQITIAQKVALTSYEAGKMSFEQIIELEQLKLKFQLEKIANTKTWAIQNSKLNFLTK
jgi:outer membrane protein TolC